jgi:hypothetical protein
MSERMMGMDIGPDLFEKSSVDPSRFARGE